MLDRITKSMVDSFSKSLNLQISKEETLYEYFVNYCVISSIYGTNDFDIEDITTGSNAQGIDGIAVIVNQRLVTSTGEIDQLIELNQTISVKFCIVQAKTSTSFSNLEIGNIMTFTNLFFKDDSSDSSVFVTPEMKHFIELKNHIFNKGDKLKKNPELLIYYVTQGTWEEDNNLLSAISVGKESLSSTNLFSFVDFKPCGATELQNLYRKTKEKLAATFKFEKRITMYSLSDEEVGYSGVVPFSEFKKIILDDSGAVKPVFEDNIRDFLGPNIDVNKSIKETIMSGDNNAFSMLNNGITIVASSIRIPGDNATISDYQIVNGCQTCNILIANMDDAENIDSLIIPIRIIATKDENLKNKITKATNSQTAIKKEQLDALSTFQKNLEEYYKTYTSEESLIYERRTGQYRTSDIPRCRIITVPIQIKTISAMFLNQPSLVAGHYGTVAKKIGDKIFRTNDRKIIYYVSALALYKIEGLFKTNAIDKHYRRSRYLAMMLFRMIVGGEEMPKFNAKKMDDYCEKILSALNDSEKCESVFKGIVDFIVSKKDEIMLDDRKCFERKETTDYFIEHFEELKKKVNI